MIFAAAALIMTAAFLLTTKTGSIELELRELRLSGVIRIELIPGIVSLPIRFRIMYKLRSGFFLVINGGKTIRLGKKRKKRKPLRVFSFLKITKGCASGLVGIKDSPDKSVLIAGSLQILLTQLLLILTGRRPRVSIKPSLTEPKLDLNVEGIFLFRPGKLIIESIKSRRTGNESSDRKHNEYVHGTHQGAG